jgi:hypothetical protein
VRFPADNRYFLEYGRLLKKALPPDTPVKFVFRADTSWDMEQQFKDLGGVVNMWVASRDILSWLPRAPRMLRERGDVIWFYSGPPVVTQPASTITQFPVEGWMWGVGGFVHWLTVGAGSDPWFHFDGGGTALVYSGERFGISGPIPSVRLKIQRNAVQELALLASFRKRKPLDELKGETARLYNHTATADWWNPRPTFAAEPTYNWSGTALDAMNDERINAKRMLKREVQGVMRLSSLETDLTFTGSGSYMRSAIPADHLCVFRCMYSIQRYWRPIARLPSASERCNSPRRHRIRSAAM